jgi:hypothetical protein
MPSLFFRKFSDKREIVDQVKNYNDLPFYGSYRGHLVIYFIAIFIILLLTKLWIKEVNISSTVFGLSLYVPMIFLAFKGYKNIFPLLLLYGVVDKIFTAAHSNRFTAASISLYIMVVLILRAWVVLNHGIKKKILPFKKTIFVPIVYILFTIIALRPLSEAF